MHAPRIGLDPHYPHYEIPATRMSTTRRRAIRDARSAFFSYLVLLLTALAVVPALCR